ncbi:MAG TPA: hypothetical protein VJT31_28405 [Rugosimonospora sp.]|nr:hypothetical protein [Rugosimonospora sp.]
MTMRHNIWLLRDEGQQQHFGAVRADTVTEFWTVPNTDRSHFVVRTNGREVGIGTFRSEHRDQMTNGFLLVLHQAEESDAGFLVIEALEPDKQDGPDQHFWVVYENEWPVDMRTPRRVPAAR